MQMKFVLNSINALLISRKNVYMIFLHHLLVSANELVYIRVFMATEAVSAVNQIPAKHTVLA